MLLILIPVTRYSKNICPPPKKNSTFHDVGDYQTLNRVVIENIFGTIYVDHIKMKNILGSCIGARNIQVHNSYFYGGNYATNSDSRNTLQ